MYHSLHGCVLLQIYIDTKINKNIKAFFEDRVVFLWKFAPSEMSDSSVQLTHTVVFFRQVSMVTLTVRATVSPRNTPEQPLESVVLWITGA